MWEAPILVILVSLLVPTATTFDLSADFSFQNNPNKVWQYGYSAARSLDPSEFRVDEYANPGNTGPIGFWHPSLSHQPGPGWYPYIAYNTSKKSEFGSMKGWAARPGEVAMEASNSGQYSLIRFVARMTGYYMISARFTGIHFGLSTTDVHVLHNSTSLFDADIDGYGGDPAFHKIEGKSPTAEYSGRIKLQANDTVTFAVGYGKNQTNSCDTTGLYTQVVLFSGTSSDK